MLLCGLFVRITLALTLLAYATNGSCCFDNCSYGFSCNPAPGTSCNIFCCNCGKGKCGKEQDVCPSQNKQKEAATRKLDSSVISGWFGSMDANGDKVLDMTEAYAVYSNDSFPDTSKKVAKMLKKKDFEKEFKKMDANKNGVIEGREFDVSVA